MFYLILVAVFVAGAVVGAILNFCADRLPLEKSLFWPAPRCASCLQPIRWYNQVPLLSYWLLGRRCRTCRAPIPARGFVVELLTGLAFALLFFLEIGCNVTDLPLLRRQAAAIAEGQIEPRVWAVFGYHALLLSFLILVSVCDLEYLEIPLAVTVLGTLVGLVGAVLFPWPFPDTEVVQLWKPPLGGFGLNPVPDPQPGLYPWPVWFPLPAWLPPGSWQLGLVTGAAGALAGMMTLRVVRFLFGLGRGIEGLGMGDADLMMLAGSFIGWQPVLVSFFVGVFCALFFVVVHLVQKGDKPMPFGPPLAMGVMLTLLAWPVLGGRFRPVFFDAWLLTALAVIAGVLLLVTSFVLRLTRGTRAG